MRFVSVGDPVLPRWRSETANLQPWLWHTCPEQRRSCMLQGEAGHSYCAVSIS